MFKFVVLLGLVACIFALNSKTEDVIRAVNSNPFVAWKAGPNKFSNWSDAQLRAILGTFTLPIRAYPKPQQTPANNLPTEFDSRKQWPGCVHPIRNQLHCGSCWAFAGSEVLSDRFCIFSNKTIDVILSPQDLVSCDPADQGCNGGRLTSEWSYMKEHGVVPDSCFPYVSGDGKVPKCPATCMDGKSFKSQKYYAKSYEHVGGWLSTHREKDIMEAIMQGPVEGAFTVYRDFMSYKSGVYHHVSGEMLGGHAIKVVGWGVDADSGLKYWIVANSWGEEWGIQGFFWIKKGNDECGLESQIYAANPDLGRIPPKH